MLPLTNKSSPKTNFNPQPQSRRDDDLRAMPASNTPKAKEKVPFGIKFFGGIFVAVFILGLVFLDGVDEAFELAVAGTFLICIIGIILGAMFDAGGDNPWSIPLFLFVGVPVILALMHFCGSGGFGGLGRYNLP